MKILSCHRHDQALSISELRNCCFFVRVNNKPDIIIKVKIDIDITKSPMTTRCLA